MGDRDCGVKAYLSHGTRSFKKEFENFNVEAVFLESQSLEELLRWPPSTCVQMCGLQLVESSSYPLSRSSCRKWAQGDVHRRAARPLLLWPVAHPVESS